MKPQRKRRENGKRVRRVSESEQTWEWAGFDPCDILDDEDIDILGFLVRN
jgi:hypothetical protein